MNTTTPREINFRRSSWLRSATYTPTGSRRGMVELLTDKGRVLTYDGVPSYRYATLHRVLSPGRFYCRRIRGHYTYTASDPITPNAPGFDDMTATLAASLETSR